MSLHASLHSGLHLYLLCVCKCVFIADGNGKAREGVSPALAPAAPTGTRLRLSMNHLVFHKVLGKGSFGKVGPIFKSFPEFNMKSLFRHTNGRHCNLKTLHKLVVPMMLYIHGKKKRIHPEIVPV